MWSFFIEAFCLTSEEDNYVLFCFVMFCDCISL